MKLGLSTLWTEEPTTRVGDRTRLFAAHLSQTAELPVVDRGLLTAPAVAPARKRRTSKPPRAAARSAPAA